MGGAMSNPHCQAFADAYNEAEDEGRTPMNWQEFLDTRSLGPDEGLLRLLNMDSVVVFQRQRRERHLSVQRRATAEPSPAEQMASFAAEMLQPSAGDGVLAAHQQVLDAHQQALARRFPNFADLQANLQNKEAEIDVLKAKVASLDMALEASCRVASRQQTSAESLEALEPRSLATDELAALNEALPRVTEAVTREVTRRLAAGAAETREAEDASVCVCCLDRPRDIVFLSCMHVVVCEQCAPRTASCPTCRVPITEKRRIFR